MNGIWALSQPAPVNDDQLSAPVEASSEDVASLSLGDDALALSQPAPVNDDQLSAPVEAALVLPQPAPVNDETPYVRLQRQRRPPKRLVEEGEGGEGGRGGGGGGGGRGGRGGRRGRLPCVVWSRSLQRALGAKNKLVFIDGLIPVPELLDLNHSAWERCNYLVHSWIFNSVTAPIAQTIVFLENAIDAWHDLKERFAKADRIRVSHLRSAINNLKQGLNSVLDYFTELRGLWEEVNS
ncbi:unnamed protein product [Trifolium pratense]|uniref:Uncharacterized protein n=1 Tax=Trifolium pratense TaxID=57577 RepID=A0ACB0MGF5_TRIPR|nr:unnamed protein product [Trifolium pratense]